MINIINEDLLNWSKSYNGDKFHSFCCDPPYFINFMANKHWDFAKNSSEAIETSRKWGESIMPHLYPGALGLMFSAPRTQHYVALGMEQAGFRIWDVMQYIYGSGFPKAQNIELMTGDSNWRGFKTAALKPAYEPILCFQAPTNGKTYTDLATNFGTACLNIDGTRIPIEDDVSFTCQKQTSDTAGMNGIGRSGFKTGHVQDMYDRDGRFPSNIIHDGSDEVVKLFPVSKDGVAIQKNRDEQVHNSIYGKYKKPPNNNIGYESGGRASRFFYTAKASLKERELGLDGFESKRVSDGREIINDIAYQRDATFRKNSHPTVKPIDLIKYLSTLLLPPSSVKNRSILIPFSGSGSEVIGAMLAGWDNIVGIEREEEYTEIAKARIDFWENNSKDTTDVKEILNKVENPKQEVSFSLF